MSSSKVILTALVGLAVLLVVGLLSAGALLRSDLMQNQIRERLSRALQMEVRFESFRPGILGATDLGNFTAFNTSGDSLSAREISLQLRLLPLLKGNIVFSSLNVTDLRLVRLEPAPVPAGTAPTGDAAAQKETSSGGPSPFFLRNPLTSLRELTVTNASLDWQRADGRSKMQMAGVDISLRAVGGGKSEGELHIKQGTFLEMVALTGFQSSLECLNQTLYAKHFTAHCGGGLVEGSAEWGMADMQPFTLQLSGTGVDLAVMSEELPGTRLSGAAEGALELRGPWLDQKSWVGGGRLDIREGTMPKLQLLKSIGQIFQIQELATLKLQLAEVRFRIGEGSLWLDPFNLNGGDIVFSAPGRAGFSGELELNAQLTLPGRLLGGKMGQLLGGRFTAPDADGRQSVAFQVTGTAQNPKTDLMERVVGGDLGKLVGGLLGGFLKPRKAEAPDAKETKPAPSAESTEAPRDPNRDSKSHP